MSITYSVEEYPAGRWVEGFLLEQARALEEGGIEVLVGIHSYTVSRETAWAALLIEEAPHPAGGYETESVGYALVAHTSWPSLYSKPVAVHVGKSVGERGLLTLLEAVRTHSPANLVIPLRSTAPWVARMAEQIAPQADIEVRDELCLYRPHFKKTAEYLPDEEEFLKMKEAHPRDRASFLQDENYSIRLRGYGSPLP